MAGDRRRTVSHPSPLEPPDAPQAALVAPLVNRFGLPEHAHAQLAALLGSLTADPLAPTAIRDPVRVVEDHLADALVALELPVVAHATEIADLGAGAGIPGLPLAFAKPTAAVWLVEANQQKCRFLERVASTCAADNVRVVPRRVESWRDRLGRFDLVTARALDPLAVVAEYAAPLLRTGGALVAWRGERDPAAEARAERAAGELGLALGEVRRVRPYAAARQRHLHVLEKVGPTPSRFPRRSGMAHKRPLGEGRSD